MNQPGKWWIGLVPLVVLWIFANVFKTESVEADLRVRSTQAAQRGSANLIDRTAVTAAGRDVTLSGIAFTPQARNSAVATVAAANGVRLVDNRITPLPVKKPYAFSATPAFDRILINGDAPLPATRAKLVDAVKAAYPKWQVADQMSYAAGMPEGFESFVAFGAGVASKLQQGEFSLSDSAITISGIAPSSELYMNTLTDLRFLPKGLTIAKADILPPEVKPYVWSATTDGTGVIISGYAPSVEVRDLVVSRAPAIFGAGARGKIDIARGAPAGDMVALVNFALTELTKLGPGTATMIDGVLSITGVGKANVSTATIEADVKARLPQGFRLGKLEIVDGAISPYGFTASKQDGTLVLSGHIPDDKIRADIKDIVAKKYFDTKIDDRLAIGKGAPDGFGAAVSAIVGGMSRLAAGTAMLTDKRVGLKGEAFYEKAIDPILAAIKAALPNGFQQETPVVVVNAGPPLANDACQPVFSGVLGKGKILFETGSTRIDADSAAILDTLVSVANRCATSKIEIGGHTDSTGSSEANMGLSKRRADAVQAYLVDAGVDAARLVTEGYGETKPVASNDNDEGRSQNRRIEFLVK